MSNVIKFDGDARPTGEQLIRREQLAAQVVAVMQSHFSRPGPEEMREILRCAEGQIIAIAISAGALTWTTAEIESFAKLASEEQPKPTPHLIRAMSKDFQG